MLVYMGAPNIDDFSPSSYSVIKVTDFEYVLYLDQKGNFIIF